MKVARVFPRRTNMTPTDDLAFVGLPTIEHLAMDIDAVHISVTFSWDLEKAEELYEAWQMLGVPVEVGGPAFDDRMGDFTPGMYVKQGIVFTSRRCSKDCLKFCPEEIRKRYHTEKYCMRTGRLCDDDDFCSYGERKAP